VKTSESIKELAGALAKMQATLPAAKRTAENTFFRSRYADLTDVIEAIRTPMASNGLAIVQLPVNDGDRMGLSTRLMHDSGEWIEETVFIESSQIGPQAAGTVISYLRRYALKALVGLADDDDDAEAAQQNYREQRPETKGGGSPKPEAPERAMILQDIKREIAEGGFAENEITYYREQARNAQTIEALRHLLAEVRADRKRTRVDLDAAAEQAFEDQERQETEQLF